MAPCGTTRVQNTCGFQSYPRRCRPRHRLRKIELGLSFVGMFHCLLRPAEWREVTSKDIHIFTNSQVPKRVWNSRRTRIKNETPAGSRQSPARARRVSGLAQLLKALQLRAHVSGAVSLYSGAGAQHAAEFQAVLGLVNSLFTLAGFPRRRCH